MGLRNCRMASSEELNAPILVESEDGSGQLTDFDVESQEAQPSWDFQTLCTYILLSLVGWGLGSLAVWMWAENYYIPYFLAVYVAGEIVCLAATFVWEGPANQCKKVLQRDVLCAFLLYILSLAGLVAVAFMVPQKTASVWYTMAFIPGAQPCVKGLISCVGRCF